MFFSRALKVLARFLSDIGSEVYSPEKNPRASVYKKSAPPTKLCVITPSGFERFFEEIGALNPEQ